MNSPQGASPFSDLETRELLHILLRESEDYDDDMLEAINSELENRGAALETLIDKIDVSFNDHPVIVENRDDAVRRLDSDPQTGETWSFGNCLEEQLVIEKATDFWLLSYCEGGEILFSFGMDKKEAVKKTLQKFLALEDWEPYEDEAFSLDDWEMFRTSSSEYYIDGWAKLLSRAQIRFLVKQVGSAGLDPMLGLQPGSDAYVMLVPAEGMSRCNELLQEIEEEADKLFGELDELENANDLEGQLEIYRKLETLLFNNSDIFFDKGSVLMEMERFDEAAEAIIHSITMDVENGLLKSAYDSEITLKKILDRVPGNLDILHCLAHLAAIRDDSLKAIALNERILSMDERDAIAHLNLGHLYYENSDNNRMASRHFQKYLELEPKAVDRESIEAILEDLKPG